MKKEIKKFYNNLKKELKNLNKSIKEITNFTQADSAAPS